MKSKSKTKNEPWAPAQPYILQGLRNTQNVFDRQQPRLDSMGDTAFNVFNTLSRNALGPNAFLMGGQGMLTDTIGGDYLESNPFANPEGNPYLDRLISRGSENIADRVGGLFSGAGRYGSGAHQGVLGDAVADYDASVRSQAYSEAARAYDAERQRMMQAASLIPALRAAEFSGIPETLAALDSAATIPWTGVNAYTGNVRTGSAGYGTTTTTKNSGLGGILGAAALGLKAYDTIWGKEYDGDS